MAVAAIQQRLRRERERPSAFTTSGTTSIGSGWIGIGFGRLDRRSLPKATAEFVAFLRTQGKVPDDASWRWRGHAYLVSNLPRRRAIDAGVMLVGDAAGLAYPQSGEGIRPAIESGLLAASTIVEANGHHSREQLEPYERQLRDRFGVRPGRRLLSRMIVPRGAATLAPWLLGRHWFSQHLLLDRWFLRPPRPSARRSVSNLRRIPGIVRPAAR